MRHAERSESTLERRTALYKSDQQTNNNSKCSAGLGSIQMESGSNLSLLIGRLVFLLCLRFEK